MKNTVLAGRYAKSLLDLSVERNELERVYQDMLYIHRVFEQNDELVIAIKSPVVKSDKKVAVLKAIFQSNVSNIILQYIDLIAQRKRESNLQEISEAFVKLYKKEKNILSAKVTSPTSLSGDARAKILAIIAPKSKGTVELIEEINTDLIGGFVLRIEDEQLDTSVKNKLSSLKKSFNNNPYIKEI
jgi:F-type H+-transporting ATPase subunit delta